MADVSRTVKIIFRGVDDLSKSMKSIGGQFNKLDAMATSVSKPLARVAKSVMVLDAALATLAGIGLVYAFNKSKEFEIATVSLSKILGEEIELIGEAQEKALELSNTYGQNAAEILESMTAFKKAGFAVQEAMVLTQNSIDLVIGAAEAELMSAEATEIIIATLKGFKAPASEAGRLTDILNKVSNEYATSVTELGVGMAKVSPIAKKMGFSFEETAGILVPIIEIFRSGDEAANALKVGLLKLIDDAKPVRDALKSIGVSQKDANGNLRSGKDILMDVAQAFTTVDRNQKLFVTGQLVGIRQAGRLVEVFDGLAKSAEITGTALGAGGSIALEVAARLKTAEIAVERFKAGFTNLGIVVGDQFREVGTSAILGATEIENVLQKAVEADLFEPIFKAIRDFGDELGDFLRDIAKALPEALEDVDFSELLNALRDVGGSITAFFDDFDPSDPKDLAEGIQFFVDSLKTLVTVTEGMIEQFQPIFNALLNWIKGINQADIETQRAAGNILQSANLVATAGLKIAAVFLVLGQHAGAVQSAFEIVVGSISALWHGFKISITSVAYMVLWAAEKVNEATLTLPGAGRIWGKTLEENTKKLGVWKERLLDIMGDSTVAVLDAGRKMGKALTSIGDEIGKADIFRPGGGDAWGGEIEIIDFEKTKGSFADLEQIINDLPSKKAIQIEPEIIGKAKDFFILNGEEIPFEPIIPKVDTEEAAEKIKELPGVDKPLEATVKLKIDELERDAKKFDAIMKSVSESYQSQGNLITGLFGSLTDLQGKERRIALKAIKEEQKMREGTFEQQKEMNDLQIKIMKENLERMERGEPLISVTGEGLEPELEAFMWKILERIQIKVNENYGNFLLGVG